MPQDSTDEGSNKLSFLSGHVGWLVLVKECLERLIDKGELLLRSERLDITGLIISIAVYRGHISRLAVVSAVFDILFTLALTFVELVRLRIVIHMRIETFPIRAEE